MAVRLYVRKRSDERDALADGAWPNAMVVWRVHNRLPGEQIGQRSSGEMRTDNSHYYDATSGDALKVAFRVIAMKISTLRLTN